LDIKLINKLEKRKLEGTIRSLYSFEDKIDFFSNDYLGLSKVKTPIYTKDIFGSTGSRLISGSNKETELCERFIANFFDSEEAVVFNSGYDANIGFFSAVPQKGDTVIYDEFIHASIRDGVRLSNSNSFSFKHNDLNDFKRKLKLAKGTIYVVIESIYSMDGDIAPLEEIGLICRQFNAYLIVDEAHAIGVFGNDGKGLVKEANIDYLVLARIVTFGKAFGSHGAAIICSSILKDYLVNFARSFIYTTALPPESYFRIRNVIDNDYHKQRGLLNENITYFRKVFKEYNIQSNHTSPIQLIRFDSVDKINRLTQSIQDLNIAIKPIFSPTVPKEREGLRVCLHSFNKFSEIDLLKSAFLKVL
jgi:8-amino-7-oxononanoate synthase